MTNDKSEPLPDDPFPELTKMGDPALRLVAWLIQSKDFHQLEQRTGVSVKPDDKDGGPYVLPVLLELDSPLSDMQIAQSLHEKYGVPRAYINAMKRKEAVGHVTARIPLTAKIRKGSVEGLVQAVTDLRALGVVRVSLGAPGLPSRVSERNRPSLVDIGLPEKREYNGKPLSGEGVIVGIIDDGCAFAHCDFLKPRVAGNPAQSRILYLWDQNATGPRPGGWRDVDMDGDGLPDFPGLELDDAAITTVLQQYMNGNLILEDKVYKHLGYTPGMRSHGTHVMDIAAGAGQSLLGIKGVAPAADIIFVQLPKAAVEAGAPVLAAHVLDGARYIFERAHELKKAAVVNISYGGYDGGHDGSSALERELDLLLAEPDRAIVLAAGNGFEARCHAPRTVRHKPPTQPPESLRWIVKPKDPTANDLEIWYDDKSKLSVGLRSPSGPINPSGYTQLGQSKPITNSSGKIGVIEHHPSPLGTANRIFISLNATDAKADFSGDNVPAPPGTWMVDLWHESGRPAEVHAWIWRDDSGRSANARRRQSRFHPEDAHPAHTISGWATGRSTISVGAYNTATQEICRYSACGPTRPIGTSPGRAKPEVYAPAEEDVRRRGILSASSLSAMPTRMNGTSASAPHITGLIALIFEYELRYANPPQHLYADEIRNKVVANTNPAKPKFNRRQAKDARVKVKQKDVERDLLGSGKGHFTETMKKLPQ